MKTTRCLFIAACAVGLAASPASAVEPTAEEMAMASRWIESRIDAGPAGAPFSFIFGSRPSTELLPAWTVERGRRDLDGSRSERRITWKDPATGLVVGLTAVVYRDFPALEWVLRFRNDGGADAPVLEEVLALDADFGLAPADGPSKLHYAEGSHEKISDFQPLEKVLGPGDSIELSSFGGRSSDGTLPFYALAADYFSEDPAVWQAIARVMGEHRALRHLFSGDFYPLGSYSTRGDAWMAWQYDRPDLGEGLVQAFRRAQADAEAATYRLSGLDPGADYAVADLDGKDSRTVPGKVLAEEGLTVRLPSRPAAAVFTYRRVAR